MEACTLYAAVNPDTHGSQYLKAPYAATGVTIENNIAIVFLENECE